MPINRSTPNDHDSDVEQSAAQALRAPDWADEHLEVLRDLRDMGMTLARTLTRQVVAQAEADEARADAGKVPESLRRGAVVDPALSFSRISRAVRLTLALEARTHHAIEAAAKAGAANDDVAARDDLRTPDGHIDYAAVRRRLHSAIHGETDYETRRAVEETIEASTDDPDEAARLKGELKERLEEEDPDEIFFIRTHWPIGEAIALICQDLGLDPDWDRWEDRPWAREEAERSPPGSPYATVEHPLDPHRWTGTERYREARGLPPLEGPLPARAAKVRGPP